VFYISYIFVLTSISYIYHLAVLWGGGVVVRSLDLQPVGRRFESRLLRFTWRLGKLFTHMCLCSPSSINWYRSKGSDSLEDNRRSGITLAIRHRLSGIPTYRLSGLRKGDEHHAYASVEYGTFATLGCRSSSSI